MNGTNDSNNRQRRHFADSEKVAILKRHLVDKVPFSNLCDELDIYPNQFYDWLNKFFEKFFDLAMMVGPGGMERTKAEYQVLFEMAGFRLARIVPTKTWVSVIEGEA